MPVNNILHLAALQPTTSSCRLSGPRIEIFAICVGDHHHHHHEGGSQHPIGNLKGRLCRTRRASSKLQHVDDHPLVRPCESPSVLMAKLLDWYAFSHAFISYITHTTRLELPNSVARVQSTTLSPGLPPA